MVMLKGAVKRSVRTMVDYFKQRDGEKREAKHPKTQRPSRIKAKVCNIIETEFEANELYRLYSKHGVLKSSALLPLQRKFDANQFFQYRDKSDMALCVASLYRGGDFMEFGSTDLNTYRNFLTACDVMQLHHQFPDMRFYGFDIFGKTETSENLNSHIDNVKYIDAEKKHSYRDYMNIFNKRGDLYQESLEIIKNHGLYVENCHLIQGYFEETLTEEFKTAYLNQGRRVGFACLDCNVWPPYKLVFEFLVDVIQTTDCFIYMDEYYSAHISQYFDQFMAELKRRHNMEARLVRNTGGFGALFYLYQIDNDLPALQF